MFHQEKDAIKQFNLWAKFYDRLFFIPFNKSNRIITKKLDPQRGSVILDVGCGTGILIQQLFNLRRNLELHGIDISPKMVEKAKEKFTNTKVKIRQGSAARLPYENNMFDYVVCSSSFHHHPDPMESLSEMYRVLRKGGKLFLSDPFNTGYIRKIICTLINFIFREKDTFIFTEKKMKEMFEQVGFKNIWQKHQWYYRLMTIGVK